MCLLNLITLDSLLYFLSSPKEVPATGLVTKVGLCRGRARLVSAHELPWNELLGRLDAEIDLLDLLHQFDDPVVLSLEGLDD